MINIKIEAIRKVMKRENINALLIPGTDPHQSEYIADYWKCREWISGFTGSAGDVVITHNHAGLWTDSRYFIQAGKQLTAPFELHKLKTRNPEYIDWLYETMSFDEQIGYNAELFSTAMIATLQRKFDPKKIKLVDVGDLFSHLWDNRPALPQNKIEIHPLKYAGQSREEKLDCIQEQIKKIGATNILITRLDDIAWLLNIRGNDVDYNPVVQSYFLLTPLTRTLFIDTSKLSDQVKHELMNSGIVIQPYNSVFEALRQIKKYSRIIIDKNYTNQKVYLSIEKSCEIIHQSNTIGALKAIKSAKEIEHLKNAHIRDGIALCNFLSWLESNFSSEQITELAIVEKIEQFRSIHDNYKGPSFGTIAAFAENGALPHYSPSTETNKIINGSNLLLIDTGGQYLDGTTDITRTLCLGDPSYEQKRDFTLVLKGHINLATAKFPYGTKGYQLDSLTREFLWKEGKNYGHGTGHGVGYFLNVHEGPQGFSTDANGAAGTVIEPGMVTSNEPGYYPEGKYGIRIENLLLCVSAPNEFLAFETISFCPLDKKMLDLSILNTNEIDWINQYHAQTFEKLSVNASNQTLIWLKEKTAPIKV